MADFITWDPRVGSSGDDRYSVAANSQWAAGSSAGFATPPTVTEINASTWYNQILGEINRRRAAFGDSARSYVSVGDKITAAKMSTCKTDIDTIRSNEGQSVYSWTATYTAGKAITIQHILDLRKALAIDWYPIPLTILPYDSVKHLRKSEVGVYPPTTFLSMGFTGTVEFGQMLLSTTYQDIRWAFSFTLPTLPTITAASLRFNVTTLGLGGLNVYQANTYESPLTDASWTSLDTLLCNGTALSEGINDVALTNFTFASGGSYTLLMCTDREIADSPTPTTRETHFFSASTSSWQLKLYP